MKKDLKAWCQQHHCEALAQLAVHEGSREALLRDGSVVPALETVSGSGLTQECRELAAAALSALSEKKLVMAVEGQKHIMLSCELVGAALHGPTCTHMSVASLSHSCTSFMHSYGLRGACRPVGWTGHDPTPQRVADCSRLCHVV